MVTLTYQERFKTIKGVFDSFTNRTIFELISRNYFDELLSPIEVGKESNVFIAKKGNEKVIVKIYRIQNCDFQKMHRYIAQDPRYEFLKKHPRQTILAWTQREFKNLLKAEKAGIYSPKAYARRNHIIVEEMIGNPAHPLKDKYPKEPQKFFNLIIKQIKKLYDNGLVHGDLSAFNILNHEEKPYFIDYSQATLTKSSAAKELLLRDLTNICKFFKKLKINKDPKEIFKKLTKNTQ